MSGVLDVPCFALRLAVGLVVYAACFGGSVCWSFACLVTLFVWVVAWVVAVCGVSGGCELGCGCGGFCCLVVF